MLTTWFKRIRLALELERKDVVEIMRLGGSQISGSQVDAWMRKSHEGRATERQREMTEEQFDAFTRGLVEWSKGKN